MSKNINAFLAQYHAGIIQDNQRVGWQGCSDHEMILSQEAARVHLEWLRSMKDRFIQQRKALKQITIQYLKDGKWVKAPTSD